MKLWVGTWNMGTRDPFQGMEVKTNPADRDKAAQLLAPFLPMGYDVYVLGVQEGICDAVFDAVEAVTETFRLPLNCRVYPARDTGKVRSRRLGRAIKAQAFIDDARAGVAADPVVSTADMVSAVVFSHGH